MVIPRPGTRGSPTRAIVVRGEGRAHAARTASQRHGRAFALYFYMCLPGFTQLQPLMNEGIANVAVAWPNSDILLRHAAARRAAPSSRAVALGTGRFSAPWQNQKKSEYGFE